VTKIAPAFRLTVETPPSRKLATERETTGTSDARMEAVVGGAGDDRVSTRMLLYLSVSNTPFPLSVRAQPSGTATANVPVLDVYVTKA
jgi:hypothetical protein